MAVTHNKEKKVKIFFLLLLIVSYFLPWTKFVPGDSRSEFLDINSSNLFEQIFSYISLIIQTGSSSFGSFVTLAIIVSLILPLVFGSITLHKVSKDYSHKGLKNATIAFSVLTILRQVFSNYYSNKLDIGEFSLGLGFFIALLSVIGLTIASLVARQFSGFLNSKTINVNTSSNQGTSAHYCTSGGNVIVGDPNYCMNCGQNLREGSVTSSTNDPDTQIKSLEGANLETAVSITPSSAIVKKPTIIWVILGVLSNISLVIVLLLMDETIANLSSGYGLIYGESPIGTLKFLFVIFSITAVGLHFLKANFTNWMMVPILFFMSYKFFRMLNPLASDISEAQQSGFLGFEADIAADAFSAFAGLQAYPLLAGILYIAIIVIRIRYRDKGRVPEPK
ncbi:hypothetical protein [Bacillus suaedae]|uniref:Uncharacterized protein n=1 Tax=Halalkalibacter suaedae TaxID=2822140 RepID=A0A940X0Q4_9BACI|nr:hypothetical protein [Bacillus suaedae]MBP3953145.1 hypothetical protein [Bacillus suaedae]